MTKFSLEGPSRTRGTDLTPEMVARLRPHLVNLTQGKLSRTGLAKTTEQDVRAIFDTHLPAFAKKQDNAAVPLMLWAHGGLVDEKRGLLSAYLQLDWWLENGVYPVFFVWETGLCDALKQIVAPFPGARGMREDLADKIAVQVARRFGGIKVWGAMKYFAELASAKDGGARFFAELLGGYVKAKPGSLELHAVGHSAGSIFHSYFIPACQRLSVPPCKTLHLLAPAIRVDEFKQRLRPMLGGPVGHLTMFSMMRELEEADTCSLGSITFYNRSLLYFIQEALEPEPETPLLGLEDSIQADADMIKLFKRSDAEAIWSKTQQGGQDSRSNANSHGGFDNDAATMQSLAFRMIGEAPTPFPQQAQERTPRAWEGPGAADLLQDIFGGFPAPTPPPLWPSPDRPVPAQAPSPSGGSGQRAAVCVGIDTYPAPATLSGCVADARAWEKALQGIGFEVTTVTNGDATREKMIEALAELVDSGKPGDVLVFQYAGHGTEVDDLDGDEEGGTNGPKDEALCPVDYSNGALLIDDDIAKIFDKVRPGVNLTCFLDCCHSATAVRFVRPSSLAAGAPSADGTRKARFIAATEELQRNHRAFRNQHPSGRRSAPGRPYRAVTFSACQDYEVAWESNGQGEFTGHAMRVLGAGIEGLSNQEFSDRVVAAFGEGRRQTPHLDAAEEAKGQALLGSLDGTSGDAASGRAAQAGPSAAGSAHAVSRLLRSLADLVETGSPGLER